MVDVLPDSRLKANLGSVMVDWELPSGKTVRCEAQRVYCANCGKLYGYVPKENTVFTFWLCNKCFDTYGAIANTYVEADQDFFQKVQYEMQALHGHDLTAEEVVRLDEEGRLGKALELLAKESPFPL